MGKTGVRRRRLLAAVGATGLMASRMARAQADYPVRPVRVIVGFTPGAAADITARVLTNRIDRKSVV